MSVAETVLGQHVLADFHGVKPALLRNTQALERLLKMAAEVAGAHILFGHFHSFGEGQGVTGVLLLQESHISLHTWPEHEYAALDIFMCGQAQTRLAVAALADALQPRQQILHTQARGRNLI